MIHSCCKDYCVTLVGLRCCLCYSTCHILRQFGERQGNPHDEGAFHTAVFTNRILGRICEAWPCYWVMKGIVPPRYIYPTVGYKQWLEDDMKWILKDEKVYVKTSKIARRIEWSPRYAHVLLFYTFMILMFLFLNVIKDWNVPNPLWKKIISSFNLSNKRINFLLSLLIVIYSLFFFPFFFPLPCNFFSWHHVGNFHHAQGLFSPNFCLDHPCGYLI